VGGYGNTMQMLGDIKKVTVGEKLQTTPGSADLYNSLLNYKNGTCKYICDEISRKRPHGLQMITVGFYNNYPCIMVYIKPNTLMLPQGITKVSSAAFEAWVDFLISYFTASINFMANEDEKLRIEMERRSSLGFLTPTIAATGQSMRINIGLIPKWYANLLVNCLIDLDDLLKEKILDKKNLPLITDTVFYNSTEHLNYLDTKYPPKPLNNLIQLLWAPADKSGKTTLQNIARTPYALDGISITVFNALHAHDKHQAFNLGLSWATNQLAIENHGKVKRLTFKSETNMTYVTSLANTDYSLDSDLTFWNMVKQLVTQYKQTDNAILHEAIEGVEYCHQEKDINNLYYFLEQCAELTFISSIKQAQTVNIGDGYGSDSEAESIVNNKRVYAKKVTTHNGMRAIWAAIIAAARYLSEQNTACNLCLDSSYYEAPLGVKLIRELHELEAINLVDKASSANTLLYDLNACITDGVNNHDYVINDKKILILDATSAVTDTVKAHIRRFADSRASMLLIVESGLKNQQIFSDRNPYGTVRIFTREKKLERKNLRVYKNNRSAIAFTHVACLSSSNESTGRGSYDITIFWYA